MKCQIDSSEDSKYKDIDFTLTLYFIDNKTFTEYKMNELRSEFNYMVDKEKQQILEVIFP